MDIIQEGRFLLAVASVVLTAVTVIIAVASILGAFAIPTWVKSKVGEAFEAARKDLAVEMDRIAGRQARLVQAGLWMNWAVLSARVGRWAFADGSPQRTSFLNEAISFTERALATLIEIEPNHENVSILRNNLAYYLSLRKQPGDGPRAWGLAAGILEESKRTGNLEQLNTYAGVAAAFPDLFSRDDCRWALNQLGEKILHNPNASEWHRQNAERHRDALMRICG